MHSLDLELISTCLIHGTGQKKVAAKVLHKGVDYLLAVKNNQPKSMQTFEQALPMNELISCEEGDAYVTNEKNRGRQETRYHFASGFTH